MGAAVVFDLEGATCVTVLTTVDTPPNPLDTKVVVIVVVTKFEEEGVVAEGSFVKPGPAIGPVSGVKLYALVTGPFAYYAG